jgi:hypothetical protein
LSDFRKLVIFLLSINNLEYIVTFSEEVMIFLRSKICRMFAHSKIDRRDIFRKLAKSLSEKDPEPSAILFEMLIAAALSCSANL